MRGKIRLKRGVGGKGHLNLREPIDALLPGITSQKRVFCSGKLFRGIKQQLIDKLRKPHVGQKQKPIIGLSEHLEFLIVIIRREPVAVVANHADRQDKLRKKVGVVRGDDFSH